MKHINKRVSTRFDELEARIKELEDRASLVYVGVHQEGKSYAVGNVCTWDGSMWYCRAVTKEGPGSSAVWQLWVRHGDAAADPYTAARKAGYPGTRQEWIEALAKVGR